MSKYGIPFAIVIAGFAIAGAIYYTSMNAPAPAAATPTAPMGKIRGVYADDHIRGNPNAPLVIVEYSDPECPFCKQFHTTLKQIINQYGSSGKVAWVFRDLPLAQLHPKAPHETEAMECAAKLGGNDAFWKYTDEIFDLTPSNNGLDVAQLPRIAKDVGLDVDKFNTCLGNGDMKAHIQADEQEAINIGADGTPYSVILYAGEQIPIDGVQTFDVMKNTIDALLAGTQSSQ